MKLDEYIDPANPNTPRPHASRLVAAAKRERAPSEDAPTPARRYAPAGIAMALIILAMLAMASYQLSNKPLVIPTPAPATHATAAASATIAPDPTAIPDQPMIDAYAAPGVVLGPIEASRPMTATAHYGDDWIQADVSGSGRVWVRAIDAPDLAISGPDLAPAPAPPVGQGMPVYQDSAPAPAAKTASEKGQKDAPDRAIRHATAVANGGK